LKTKLNLALDADMVTWFRALGRGYQPRMNAVLRAYMHAVIAKEVDAPLLNVGRGPVRRMRTLRIVNHLRERLGGCRIISAPAFPAPQSFLPSHLPNVART
jgi:hypothetical protein